MEKLVLNWNEYFETAKEAVAEGLVLLENKNVLPLAEGTKVSVFGRIQENYYKSGTGSGGMVNVNHVYTIPEGLKETGKVVLNEKLQKIYADWIQENPFDEGAGWGNEPWSQVEMELSDEVVSDAASESDVAIVILGRTAGEDRDASEAEGSYKLTALELDMLRKVRKGFSKLVVLLNIGGQIDLSFMDEINPEAVMIVWQGGMIGGLATAEALTGIRTPSGRLSDTWSLKVTDCLANESFNEESKILYKEDIYVGYRYFETFAKDKVRYPFGYGLSYTEFETKVLDTFIVDSENQAYTGIDKINASVITMGVLAEVKNVGNMPGKEVVQAYIEAPVGRLGKAKKVLVAFGKTRELQPGESDVVELRFKPADFASFDDDKNSANAYCNILELGIYKLHLGKNVSDTKMIKSYDVFDEICLEKLSDALAPVEAFERYRSGFMKDGSVKLYTEMVEPYGNVEEEHRAAKELTEIPHKDTAYVLKDVLDGKVSTEDFVAQFSDDDLFCIVRGEGMGSSKVTPGTAAAFGGVSEGLKAKGIPAVCCDDGPSGMRLDSGVKAFSLPNGTMLASTFNPGLVEKLYSYTGIEMVDNNVECLLGPGMNIHRHPLNGRNFEYFSEDPYLTGMMAAAMVKGLKSAGVTGTIKHFCGNNQEFRRHFVESIISLRALREIYLKGFEMAVKLADADSIMTTYGSVNGLYTAGSYDLNTTILRDEWGFKGTVMTDWWASVNRRDKKEANKKDLAQMVKAQNDMYMVCSDSSWAADGDNLEESFKSGFLTRAELQRCAVNICNFVKDTQAMKRFIGQATEVEHVDKPVDNADSAAEDIEYIKLTGDYTVDLTYKPSVKDSNFHFAFDVENRGIYKVTLTGCSALSKFAQIPCSLFSMGSPVASFSFRGSGKDDVSIEREIALYSKFALLRVFVGRNGVELKSIRFEKVRDFDDM